MARRIDEPEDIETDYRPERVAWRSGRLIVLSGCSGGGKSMLLAALARQGIRTREEAGRQIVREQTYLGGDGLPWLDAGKFAVLTASRAIHFLVDAARLDGPTVFDRSFIDQVVALERLDLPVPADLKAAVERLRYSKTVFLVPPWPEIFARDQERRHGFQEAVAEHDALIAAYGRFGYRPVVVPKLPVPERAAFVMERIRGLAGAAMPIADGG